MAKRILILIIALISSGAYGQDKIIIDGDEVILRDSLEGKVTLLTSIKRTGQNPSALWIEYDRRPGLDPWIKKPIEGLDKYSNENFIRYLKEKGIHVIGAITTFDDCLCAKLKGYNSPDMHLIYFKIELEQWSKLKELYPEIVNYSNILKF